MRHCFTTSLGRYNSTLIITLATAKLNQFKDISPSIELSQRVDYNNSMKYPTSSLVIDISPPPGYL